MSPPKQAALALATLVALLLGGGWALAEPPKLGLSMRIVSLKAGGKLQEGDKPALHPNIKAYRELLTPLGYDRYRGLDAEIHAATLKDLVQFQRLPLSYTADVRWSAAKEGKLNLSLSVTRPGKKPKDKRIKVLDLKVDTPSGQHFLIRVRDAYPDGDMLLLVTAQLEPVE